ncbi:hypothetical protein SCP_0503240 [Sparassis crispa]|uniref:Uncharacterized protein n=1 Tax=Sparassis crispa TaxID=139825 RepID=A0A401GM58_9APHY|nr:hypothetical protein SCP_0503240 [Sparassis crispa]GBE83276.1 hypothetical protein SCP_0503240 [Sparassis crispa]
MGRTKASKAVIAGTKATPPKQRRSKKASTAVVRSLDTLQETKEAGKRQFKHAQSTRRNYDGTVTRMRKWAAEYGPSEGQDVDISHVQAVRDSAEGAVGVDPEFRLAFTGHLKKCSGDALALYITFKCLHEGLGTSTATRAHAAIKKYWEELDGDVYRGRWHFDEHAQRWAGNPVMCAEVQNILDAVNNKYGADGGERTHSAAMQYEYLDQVIKWSESVCPEISVHIPPVDVESRHVTTKHLLFRAFATTGWTIWSRNFETVALKCKHYILNAQGPNSSSKPFFKLELVDRKGWRRKNLKDRSGSVEHDLQGNTYHIYDQPTLPSANAYRHLPAWIQYLEAFHYGRPLHDDDYLFPTISTNGMIQPHLPVSHDTIQQWLNEFTKEAGVAQLVRGEFTTHCFRHGGTQYRFMFAAPGDRWTLARVRWWGRWAKGEHCDMLNRYLLDELYMYEESHADTLHSAVRAEGLSFLQDDMSAISDGCFRESLLSIRQDLGSAVSTAMSTFFARQSQSAVSTPTDQSELSPSVVQQFPPYMCPLVPIPIPVSPRTRSTIATSRPSAVHLVWMEHHLIFPNQAPMPTLIAATRARPSSLPPPNVCVLNVPIPREGRRLKSESWRDIVELWETGIPEQGVLPLKDWPKAWLTGANKPRFALKHHQCRVIAEEYLRRARFRRDDAAFLQAYPKAVKGHTALLGAINRARAGRGELVERKSKNGSLSRHHR